MSSVELDALGELLAIPSVSAAGDREPLRWAAEYVCGWAARAGFPLTAVLEAPGTLPAAWAVRPGPPGAPAVLLYAHHDVVPVGERALWRSDPFAAVASDGRLYARGAADDKAAVAIHLAAAGPLLASEAPLHLMLFVEGEEEIGSPHALALLREAPGWRAPELAVVADAVSWTHDVPYMATATRGSLDVLVTARALAEPVHSGIFGGVVPDAGAGLLRALATLHDADGAVAVPGLRAGEPDASWAPRTEEEYLAGAGALPGVRAIGRGSVEARLCGPAVDVLGIDLPRPADASYRLSASATARLDVRLAPGQAPADAFAALERHLRAHAGWGVELSVASSADGAIAGFQSDPRNPRLALAAACLEEVWGAPVHRMGGGGTIRFAGDLADECPDCAILLVGAADEQCNAHGPNESVPLVLVERLAAAEALLLRRLSAA